MNFHVGQKVVCVDDRPNHFGDMPPPCVKVGAVFTVRGMHPEIRYGSSGVYLFEVEGCNGKAFRAERFRPVIERKTDISILVALLNPARERVDG